MYKLSNLSAIILAAGEGKRMKSKYSKVLHKISGIAMVECVYQSVKSADIEECVVVVGHRAEDVKAYMGDKVKFAFQEQQLGTGHAVMQTKEVLDSLNGYTIVLNGDTPLITPETIKNAINYTIEQKCAATVITAEIQDPTGYGRIARDENGNVQKIIEQKDATEVEKQIKEVNSGLYCFETSLLFEVLKEVNNSNSQGEYYLTDTLEILTQKGYKVGAIKVQDSTEIMGVNSRQQLSQAQAVMTKRILEKNMAQGVTIIDSASTYISYDAVIGMDTIIYPGSIIEGKTIIGEDCIIGPNVRINESQISYNVKIENSVILDSFIGKNSTIGPFSYLRPGSIIGENVKIGDFVEIKNSNIGSHTKISHLAYVGDAEIGSNVNLGCGAIIVNYDGKKKNKTIIEDNVFVGCNSNLVSPVIVRENSYIAAGSTITQEVPENSLAIARSRQVNKRDWVIKKG